MRRVVHILFLLAPMALSAQDVHFSQFTNSPLVVNPALAGDMDLDQRLSLIYRDQWASAGTPFRTYAASYDLPLMRRKLGGNHLGLGVSAFRDKAGRTDLSDTRLDLSIAYALRTGRNARLAFGLQFGYGQRSAMLNGLRWDSQFNGSGYDPSLSSNEAFADERTAFFDGGAGATWSSVLSGGVEWQVGAAAFHLLEPRVSLFGSSQDVLLRRYTVHGSARWQGRKWTWSPRIFAAQQGGVREITLGGLVARRMGMDSRFTSERTSNAFHLGCFYRVQDAIIPTMQFELKRRLVIGMSYDINVSRLQARTHYQGGFEVGLQWIGAFQDRRVDLPGPRSH